MTRPASFRRAALVIITSAGLLSPLRASAQTTPEPPAPAPSDAPAPTPDATPPAPTPDAPPAQAPKEGNSGRGANPFAPPPGAKGVGRDPLYFHVEPFVSIVGGAKLDNIIQPPSLSRNDRASAIMLADFGLRGEIADWISFESEMMANGGTGLRGTSVYDGQAALQVRKQVIHLGKNWWAVEVGRVIDEASVDYFSAHVADTFLQDTATRNAFLFGGFNLGNGVRATAEVLPGLRLGLAANAGNPTSSSSLFAVGGAFPPYDRIFLQAAQKTRSDINGYPDDQFHSYALTPSVLFNTKVFEARAAAQMFVVDTNANEEVSRNIRGYNIRGGVRLHLLDDMLSPYANASVARNDVVDPVNLAQLLPDKYTGIGLGGGMDFNYQHRFGKPNGIGVQFVQDQSKTGGGPLTKYSYLNVGTSYWLSKYLAVGARFALWSQEQKEQNTSGERSALLTLRLML